MSSKRPDPIRIEQSPERSLDDTKARRSRFQLTSPQYIAIGFLGLSFLGLFLLQLPISLEEGRDLDFVSALFTAISAVSTTGLIVVDTPSTFSFFGEFILFFLIQVGGLGYMVFTAFLAEAMGIRLTIKGQTMLRDDLGGGNVSDMVEFSKRVVSMTLIIEFIGMLLYLPSFYAREESFWASLWSSWFHSVSAFCTAGFSLYSDSLGYWADDPWVNLVTIFLVSCGALGFITIDGFWAVLTKRRKYLSLQTKLAVTVLSALIVVAFLSIWTVEIARSSHSEPVLTDSFWVSLFQPVSAQTGVGFNTVDFAYLQNGSLFALMVLMFIGGVPGGTSGGIKSTTLGVILSSVWNTVRGREEVRIFYRTIPEAVVRKASMVFFLSLGFVLFGTFVLTLIEQSDFIEILFEVVSAFGTVGLSIGITGELGQVSQLILAFIMLIGRIGPLTFALAVAQKQHSDFYQYIEEEVVIG
jgi:trk system potassium uptake protein TrkH